MVPLEEHATLNLGAMSLSSTLGAEMTRNKQTKKKFVF